MTSPEIAYRLIGLSQGQFAKVSPHRFEELNRYRWYAWWSPVTQSFYAKRNLRGNGLHRTLQLHRVILGLDFGDQRQGDHRNHDTLDCTDENLRIATRIENNCNSRMRKHNTSGFKGVSKTRNRWVANIQIDRQLIYLGCRPTAAQAYFELYVPAALKYHGEFACLG